MTIDFKGAATHGLQPRICSPAGLHERNVGADEASRRKESALQVVILIDVGRQAQSGVETLQGLQQASLGKLGLMHGIHPQASDAAEQPGYPTMPPKAHPPDLTHDG